MKVKELIAELKKLDPERDIMILDGFNGGGHPREINLGPSKRVISSEDAEDCADCEGREGELIYKMGYGFY
jgi:hypothetical protein